MWFLVGWLGLVCSAVAQARVQVTDDAGSTVVLQQPAKRVISLAPHLTETMFAIGAGDRLVGVSDYSDYPPAAHGIRRVAASGQIDLEAVLALRPDLILAWKSGNPSAQVDSLRRLGFTIFLSEPRRILDVATTMDRLGVLTGTESTAQEASSRFKRAYQKLRSRYSNKPRVRVFFEVWGHPLITVNGSHWISHVIRLCGGINVFSDLSAFAPQVSVESVLARDPDVIVASAQGGRRPEWLNDWRKWPNLKAVRRGNLYFIDADLINRNGPRILQGAQLLCEQLQQARNKR